MYGRDEDTGGARRRGKRLGNAEMGGLCIDFFGKNWRFR
jgi:hypothetical protein